MSLPSRRAFVSAVVFGSVVGALVALVQRSQEPTGMGVGEETPPARLAIGAPPGGEGWITLYAGDGEKPLAATQIPWKDYCEGYGSTEPVLAQLDGDSGLEVVVGLGPCAEAPGGVICVLDDLDHGLVARAWVHLPGVVEGGVETQPSCGDLDGDGRDEIVVGLGAAVDGRSIAHVIDDMEHGLASLGTIEVPWSTYAAGEGAPIVEQLVAIETPESGMRCETIEEPQPAGGTHPAVGDLDGDKKAEIVIGLAGAPRGGWLAVYRGLQFERWLRAPLGGYADAGGATWPACADLDGNGTAELVVGGDRGMDGRAAVLSDVLGEAKASWVRVPWSEYASLHGGVRPVAANVDEDRASELLLLLADGTRATRMGALLDDALSAHRFLGWRRGWAPGMGVVTAAQVATVGPPDPLREARDAALRFLQESTPGGIAVVRSPIDGTIVSLVGEFPVPPGARREDAARDLLVRASGVWGLRDARRDLRLDEEGGDPSVDRFRLTFRQTIDGVPLYGGGLDVHFGSRGEITSVTGHVDPRAVGLDLDPVPSVSVEEALPSIPGIGNLPRGVLSPPGLFAWVDGTVPRLVWRFVDVGSIQGGAREYLVDAHTGRLVREIGAWAGAEFGATATGVTPTGHRVALAVTRVGPEGSTQGGVFVLKDFSRVASGGPELLVFDARTIAEGVNLAVAEATGQIQVVENPDDTFDLPEHAGPAAILRNLGKCVDYWGQRFHRSSFDGNAGRIRAFFRVNQAGSFDQATAQSDTGVILVGNENNSVLDILAHEFTHAVVFSTLSGFADVSTLLVGEGAALHEHLADAVSCFTEMRMGSETDDFASNQMDAAERDQRHWIFGDEPNSRTPGARGTLTGSRVFTTDAINIHIEVGFAPGAVGPHTGHDVLLGHWLYLWARGTHAFPGRGGAPAGVHPISRIRVNGLFPQIPGATLPTGGDNVFGSDEATREFLEEVYHQLIVGRRLSIGGGFEAFRAAVEDVTRQAAGADRRPLDEARKAFEAIGMPAFMASEVALLRRRSEQVTSRRLDTRPRPTGPVTLSMDAGEEGRVIVRVKDFITEPLDDVEVTLVEREPEGDLSIGPEASNPTSVARGAEIGWAFGLTVAPDAEARTARLRATIRVGSLPEVENMNPKTLDIDLTIAGQTRNHSREPLPIRVKSHRSSLDGENTDTAYRPSVPFRLEVELENTSNRAVRGLTMRVVGFGSVLGGGLETFAAEVRNGPNPQEIGFVGARGTVRVIWDLKMIDRDDEIALLRRARREGLVAVELVDSLGRRFGTVFNFRLAKEFRDRAMIEVEQSNAERLGEALKSGASGKIEDFFREIQILRGAERLFNDTRVGLTPFAKKILDELKRLKDAKVFELVGQDRLRRAEEQEKKGQTRFARGLLDQIVRDLDGTQAAKEARVRLLLLPAEAALGGLLTLKRANEAAAGGDVELALDLLAALKRESPQLTGAANALKQTLAPASNRLAELKLDRVRELVAQGRAREAGQLLQNIGLVHADDAAVLRSPADMRALALEIDRLHAANRDSEDISEAEAEARVNAEFTRDFARRTPLLEQGRGTAEGLQTFAVRTRFAFKLDRGLPLTDADRRDIANGLNADLRRAETLEAAGDKELAAFVLETVIRQFAQEPAAGTARERLDRIRAELAQADLSEDPEVRRRGEDGRTKVEGARQSVERLGRGDLPDQLLALAQGLEETDVLAAADAYQAIARQFSGKPAAIEAAARFEALRPRVAAAQADRSLDRARLAEEALPAAERDRLRAARDTAVAEGERRFRESQAQADAETAASRDLAARAGGSFADFRASEAARRVGALDRQSAQAGEAALAEARAREDRGLLVDALILYRRVSDQFFGTAAGDAAEEALGRLAPNGALSAEDEQALVARMLARARELDAEGRSIDARAAAANARAAGQRTRAQDQEAFALIASLQSRASAETDRVIADARRAATEGRVDEAIARLERLVRDLGGNNPTLPAPRALEEIALRQAVDAEAAGRIEEANRLFSRFELRRRSNPSNTEGTASQQTRETVRARRAAMLPALDTIVRGRVEEARRLEAEGRPDEALAAFEAIFDDDGLSGVPSADAVAAEMVAIRARLEPPARRARLEAFVRDREANAAAIAEAARLEQERLAAEAEAARLAEAARQAEAARLAEAARAEEARLAAEARRTEEARLRAEEEARRAAEEASRAEEAQQDAAAAEARRLADEAARAQEEARAAEQARLAEEARQKEEERRKAEEARLAEEAAKAAEQAKRLAEEARRQEEERAAAELLARRQEAEQAAAEKLRLDEEARQQAEAARLAEEERKASEARRLEEARRAEEERLRAEEARKTEEARLAAEEAAAAAKAADAKRLEQDAARLAEEARAAAEAAKAAELRRLEEARTSEIARLRIDFARATQEAASLRSRANVLDAPPSIFELAGPARDRALRGIEAARLREAAARRELSARAHDQARRDREAKSRALAAGKGDADERLAAARLVEEDRLRGVATRASAEADRAKDAAARQRAETQEADGGEGLAGADLRERDARRLQEEARRADAQRRADEGRRLANDARLQRISEVGRAAAAAAANPQDASLQAPLGAALRDADPAVRAVASAALVRLGAAAEGTLLEGTRDPRAEVRRAAVQGITAARLGSAAVLDALRGLASDPDRDVRLDAARALMFAPRR